MTMDPTSLFVQLLIVAAAIVYGLFAGRAKAARMRDLGRDLQAGNPRGYAVIAIVAAIVLFAMLA